MLLVAVAALAGLRAYLQSSLREEAEMAEREEAEMAEREEAEMAERVVEVAERMVEEEVEGTGQQVAELGTSKKYNHKRQKIEESLEMRKRCRNRHTHLLHSVQTRRKLRSKQI